MEYVDGDYEKAVRRSNMRAISDARAAEWVEVAAEQKGAQCGPRGATCPKPDGHVGLCRGQKLKAEPGAKVRPMRSYSCCSRTF